MFNFSPRDQMSTGAKRTCATLWSEFNVKLEPKVNMAGRMHPTALSCCSVRTRKNRGKRAQEDKCKTLPQVTSPTYKLAETIAAQLLGLL